MTTWTERTSPSTSYSERTSPSSEYNDEYGLWITNYYPWKITSLPWAREIFSTDWDNLGGFLLQEAGDYILLEDGGRIIIQREPGTGWTNRNEPSSSWTQ